MDPLYLAVSFPPDFQFPADDVTTKLLREVVMPTAREHKLAFAAMIGVRRGVNPLLRSAGDSLGKADVTALERLCAENPEVRFWRRSFRAKTSMSCVWRRESSIT
jgi:hypothetical protein